MYYCLNIKNDYNEKEPSDEILIDPSVIEKIIECDCGQTNVLSEEMIDSAIIRFIQMLYLPTSHSMDGSIISILNICLDDICIHCIGNILYLANYYDVEKIINYLIHYIRNQINDLITDQFTLIYGFKLAKMYHHVDQDLTNSLFAIMNDSRFTLEVNWPRTFERELGSEYFLDLMKKMHEYNLINYPNKRAKLGHGGGIKRLRV